MKSIILTLSILVFFSCKKEDDLQPSDTFCYSFDIRGCETDQYSEVVDVMQSVSNRESAMSDWLEAQKIKILDLNLTVQYHDAYCEACYVCTNGDRYTFTTDMSVSSPTAKGLELMNFQKEECE